MITIALPSSKSISNRLLILRSVCGLSTPVEALSEASDTRLMQDLLEQISKSSLSRVETLDCGNAGTVLRFLCPYLAFKPGQWILRGDERLSQRPMRGLVEALQEMGVQIAIDSEQDSLPIYIAGASTDRRQGVLEQVESAQYVSGLMMAAPLIGLPFTIHVEQMHQYPYVIMTQRMMEQLGFSVLLNDRFIHIQGQATAPSSFRVEADWSAASYVYAALALRGEGEVFLPRLRADSLQGDAIVARWMERFGVRTQYTADGVILSCIPVKGTYFEADFRHYPDLAPTFAVLSALMGFQAELSGLGGLKDKECNRLECLCESFEELGVRYLHLDDDSLLIWPSELSTKPRSFKVYHDHRMVMSLWLSVFRMDGVSFDDPDCVSKSFPMFHQELSKMLA